MATDPDAGLHAAVPGRYRPGSPIRAQVMPQLPTFAGTPTLDQLAQSAPPTPAAVPPLGFFDTVKLGYKQAAAGPDWGFNQMDWRESALDEIRSGLRKRGITPVDPFASADQKPGETPPQAVERHWRELFGQIAKVHAADPKFLPAYAVIGDRAGFEQLLDDRRKAALGEVDEAAPDGLGVGGFIGGVARGFKDPASFIPVGGEVSLVARPFASQLIRTATREAAANMAFTAVTEPLVRKDAQTLGIERGFKDFAFDLGVSGVAGAAIGGAAIAVPRAPRAIGESLFPGAVRQHDADAFGKALKREIGRADLPQGSPFRSFDATVARLFGETVPREQRTPDEQAAMDAIERDAEVHAGSPFVSGPVGDDHHAQSLDLAMRAVAGEPVAPRTVRPIARDAIARPEDVAAARSPGRELLKAKIHSAEGDGANALGSGAYGPYQFIPRTWVDLFRRRYPNDTRSFEQIAALRGDAHLNDVLINDLISENSAALRHAGFEENAGNLYLAHVLGHDRAVTVLRADPNAKLGDLLPHGYFAKNPFRPTDSAASLVHWAYGKMGDRAGVPVHLATPEASQGAEAIVAGEADPLVQPATGEFDVAALYGDVGMTDRPMLRPELFDSPEAHADAQVRFERERDAAEGFAPVMSRDEAFSPRDHFDALRGYQGTVTTDAIGEALGLSPGEVRRVVGAMQSLDRNSPYVLTKGRPEVRDKAGNIKQTATEPGRVIRRPVRPDTGPATLLEFLSQRGGLNDVGGDLRSMDAQLWHKGKPFRRQLIQNDGHSLDDAFQTAIEAGYFPEHQAYADTYDKLPDTADLLAAIDAELHGKPRYPVDQLGEAIDRRRARFGDEPPPEVVAERPQDHAERLFERVGHNYEPVMDAAHERGVKVSDDMLIDASDLIDAGMAPHDALDHAIMAEAARDLEEFAALAGELRYDVGDEWDAYNGAEAEIRDGEPADRGDDPGGGRSTADARSAPPGGTQLAELANDPARGEFRDPVGPAAAAQADSLIHDLEMQERPAEGEAAAPDHATYRLDEEGGESDLSSILDEIDQAQKAAATMRDCLKPKGGGE